jgi:hypothetical protein
MNFNKQIFFLCSPNETTSVRSNIQVVGELLVNYAGITSLTCPLGIQPGGVVSIQAPGSTFDIQAMVSSYGELNISAGANVILEAPATFFQSSSIIGGGTLNCQSCTAIISGQVNLGYLNFPGGSMTFEMNLGLQPYLPFVQSFNQSGSSYLILTNNSPLALNVTVSNFYFGGGTISSNQNSKLNLQANFIVANSSTFYGSSPFQLNNIAFINEGTTTFSGSAAIGLTQNSLIYNTPSGVFNVVTQMNVNQLDQSGGFMSEIQNYGWFQFANKVPSTLALDFHNGGNGPLVLDGQLSITAGFFTQDPGDNPLTTLNANGVLQLQNPAFFLGGTLAGTGRIEGAVTLGGGVLMITTLSSLTIQGQFQQRGEGLLIVDVSSQGQLMLQAYQLYGGGLLLLSTNQAIAPDKKKFVTFQSYVGSGFSSIPQAQFNSSFGLAYTTDASDLSVSLVPLPQITALMPTSGTTAGGTKITITGTHFAGSFVQVFFRNSLITTQFLTEASLIAQVPSGTGTMVGVYVVVDGRTSNEMQWSYNPPIIQSIAPLHGPTLGGNLITITGNNFGEYSSVLSIHLSGSGLSQTCIVTQVSQNQIIFTASAGVGANITVTLNVDGQSTSSAQLYSFDVPILQSVYPSSIIAGNKEKLLITGQNLGSQFPPIVDSNITILIGDNKCLNVQQTSITTYTCISPSLSSIGSFPIVIMVQSQISNNLTFWVVDDSTNNNDSGKDTGIFAWPWPWWYFAIEAGAGVIFLVLGLVIGCVVSKKKSSDDTVVPYERIVN